MTKITKSVSKSFFNVYTGGKNDKGFANKSLIGSVLAAGSVLGGHELKYDTAQIDLAKVKELQDKGILKGSYLQFQIQSNPKAEAQLLALKEEIENLKQENANLKAASFTQTQVNPDDLPF